MGQSGPGSNDNEGVLRILNSFCITETLTPDKRWGRGSYPSEKMQSVYSTAPADWVN